MACQSWLKSHLRVARPTQEPPKSRPKKLTLCPLAGAVFPQTYTIITMNPIVKFVVETAINSRKSSDVRSPALDLLFAKMAVTPLQRAWRARNANISTIEVDYSCDCKNCAVCDGDCPVKREMSFLAAQASLEHPTAIAFAWEGGRMVPIAWKDRWRGVQIECDHDHFTYCGNCDSKELYRNMEKWCA